MTINKYLGTYLLLSFDILLTLSVLAIEFFSLILIVPFGLAFLGTSSNEFLLCIDLSVVVAPAL